MTDIIPNYTYFGKSLIPLLQGVAVSHRDAVFCEGGRLYGEEQAMEKESKSDQHPAGLYWPRLSFQISDDGPYHGKAVMCRTKDFKYVKRLYEKDELYDLERDPCEIDNIIDKPEYKSVVSDMKEKILVWYLETCDVVPF